MSLTHPEADLIPLLRDELNPAERERVQNHVAGCAQCRTEMDAMAATMRTVAARLEELSTPEWSAYRRELRIKLAARQEARAKWWRRPAVLWPSLATAGVGIAALFLALTMRPASHGGAPGVDLLAMEQGAEQVDVGLLNNYPMVEKLDLLENYDVIENLDQTPSDQNHNDQRS